MKTQGSIESIRSASIGGDIVALGHGEGTEAKKNDQYLSINFMRGLINSTDQVITAMKVKAAKNPISSLIPSTY
eukprot:CAMPEP_0172317010 /NCGR_PEP_ID=MMETSP1058-20130122/30263_1 /TAXON_ID=83371 /ORGANISM="Detonula confervacea, Strain CCMP 353" /LENGTH=73 /DNA_ID=CAMNT_0013031461 /DNA_START=88 /DNA_END=306 /DNA_ORIENTATION=+